LTSASFATRHVLRVPKRRREVSKRLHCARCCRVA
jgi:hypothetical protein